MLTPRHCTAYTAVTWLRSLIRGEAPFDLHKPVRIVKASFEQDERSPESLGSGILVLTGQFLLPTQLNLGPAAATYSAFMALLKTSILMHLLNFTFSPVIIAASYVTMAVQTTIFISGSVACAAAINTLGDLISFVGGPNLPPPRLCRPLSDIVVGSSTVNVLVDLAILVMPLLILQPLQMPVGRKLQLLGVLAAGGSYV